MAGVDILILELKHGAGGHAVQGRTRRERAVEMLIEPGVVELRRKCQILDRLPRRAGAELQRGELEAAGGVGRTGAEAPGIGGRKQERIPAGSVGDMAVGPEHRGPPRRIPVVLVERTDFPGIALADRGAVGIDAIEHIPERHAAIADLGKTTRTGRIKTAAEDILGSAVGERALNLQAVAHAGRQILQLERADDGIAPGRVGMAARAVGRRVIGAVHLVRRGADMQ